MNNQPIGIYDSGFGGLTLWRAVRDRLPSESLVYLGDGKNCPYGSRSNSQIRELADEAVSKLIDMGCKLIVVACNTATAAAIDFLRTSYPNINIVGMEPAIKPACLSTKSGVVGVIATERSLEGDLFHRTAAKYAQNIRVIPLFGRGFVEIVESNMEDTPYAEIVLSEVVKPMVKEGVDQIVLGCSHYPFLIPTLRRIAPSINFIDPSPAVARRVDQLLVKDNLKADEDHVADYLFTSFADDDYLQRLIAKSKTI